MKLQKHIFITATDTDAGKTYVTGLLAKALKQKNVEVALFKPIASGATNYKDPLTNEDVARHHEFDNQIPVECINAWCFEPAIAPHIAAEDQGTLLNLQTVDAGIQNLIQNRSQIKPYNIGLIEGAGGWKLPLNKEETLDQWVIKKELDVIIIVGMKLGCINHALLTVEQILNANGKLLGWIANVPEGMDRLEENLETLKNLIPVPCLGEVRTGQTEFHISEAFNIFGI